MCDYFSSRSAPFTVGIKKLNSFAKTPVYSSEGAGCFDLFSCEMATVYPKSQVVFKTGLAFEVPKGFVMLMFPRSGLSTKFGLSLTNCVGVIDSDYRGEVKVPLFNHFTVPFTIMKGDKVAQCLIIPFCKTEFVDKETLSETKRGTGGFGSTGR